jgi:hypothetical protein
MSGGAAIAIPFKNRGGRQTVIMQNDYIWQKRSGKGFIMKGYVLDP